MRVVEGLYNLWDKDSESTHTLGENLRIALAPNSTHLQGENTVMLYTGLRKTRIQWKR